MALTEHELNQANSSGACKRGHHGECTERGWKNRTTPFLSWGYPQPCMCECEHEPTPPMLEWVASQNGGHISAED